MIAIDKYVINMIFLDYCSRDINEYRFHYLYMSLVKQKKFPKFFSKNKVYIIMCQNYLLILERITLVKQMLIVQCHPIMSII